MSHYNVVITEPAEADLKEVAEYISRELKEPSTAQLLIAKIGESIIGLEHFPLRNALVTDEILANLGIRKLIVDNYIVFYIVSEMNQSVTIIRILYGKRNWDKLL